MNAKLIKGLPVGLAIAAVSTAWAGPTGSAAAPATTTTRDIRGGGGWKSDRKTAGPLQHWDLHISRADDDTIRGRVNLAGSPLASAGNVQGRIVGHDLTGTITDDNGKPLATFTGVVAKDGMRGTYVDRTGETGSWAWDGPPPQ